MLLQQRREKQEQENIVVKTVVKQENNNEIFVTDAPDVDFEQLNEESTKGLREQFES